MASAQMPTISGIEETLKIAEQRCEALRANLNACFQARSQEIQASSNQFRLSSNPGRSDGTGNPVNSTNGNPEETSEKHGTDEKMNKVRNGSTILPSLLNFPGKNLKNGTVKSAEELQSGDQLDWNITFQKLQDLLLSFTGVRQIASLPSKESRPTTPSSDKDQTPTEFSDTTKQDQYTACDETSFHTDKGYTTKDDFLSADEQPLSSCEQILSKNDDDSSEKSSKKIEKSLPILSRLKKPRSTRPRKLNKYARKTDVERVYSTRFVKTARAGNLKTARAARLPSAAASGAVELLARSFSETKLTKRRSKKEIEWAVSDEDRAPVLRYQMKSAQANLSRSRQQKQPRSNKSAVTPRPGEASDELTGHRAAEDIPVNIHPENMPPLRTQHFKHDCEKDRPRSSDHMKIEPGCSLLDEPSSTNQLVDEPTGCIGSHSPMEERRSPVINDTSLLSIFDVHHSYERPTVSSQLKRVERRLSVQDIHKEIAKRKDHPFVVATATTPSHNIVLSRESVPAGENSRPASRTDLRLSNYRHQSVPVPKDDFSKQNHKAQAQRKQTETERILEVKHVPSTTSTTASGRESLPNSIDSRQFETSYRLEKEEGGRMRQSLPLSFSRQLRCVLERLRNEMFHLVTKRAIASSNVSRNSFPQPSLLAPNTGIMEAKVKWATRLAKNNSPGAMNSEETIQTLEEIDTKLQATEDEVFVIVTLCQEIDKMKEQLNALHRRVSLYSITNVPASSDTQMQVQQLQAPEPRRLRSSARRTPVQNYSRSKSFGFKS